MRLEFSSVIYENPLPQLRSVMSTFPGIAQLPSGRIIAVYTLGEAFESIDGTAYISFSDDGGKTFSAPRRILDKSEEKIRMTDYAKPTVTPDGKIIIFGYRYFRENPDLPLGNAENGGTLPDEIFMLESHDEGGNFTKPAVIPSTFGNSVEASAPLYVLSDGSLATPITCFPDWSGNLDSRLCGRLLISRDGGKSFDDSTVCTAFPGDTVTCYEQRMCETESGALVVVSWNEDTKTGERMNNHITISRDGGRSFSAPIDTGVRGQATGILSLGGERVMTLHAVRRDTDAPGIYAVIADVSCGWRVISSERVWAPKTPMVKSANMAEIFSFLKFGQPSAIKLEDGGILMTHWTSEDGVYKTVVNKFCL